VVKLNEINLHIFKADRIANLYMFKGAYII